MIQISLEEERELFLKYTKTKNETLRNGILERYLFIAQIVAKKFVGRGVEYDDLYQVAALALVKAIERFDPEKNVRFSSFATPSLVGEVKNYFRDKTRLLHISRKDSEQLVKLAEVKRDLLTQGKRVLPKTIAECMEISEDRVLELLEMQKIATMTSMDNTVGDDDTSLSELLGDADRGYDDVETRDLLKRSMAMLDREEQAILHARFWQDKSQRSIAEELGVSQMYVSRKEKKILAKMRETIRKSGAV